MPRSTTPRKAPPSPARRGVATFALALSLTATVVACTGGDDEPEATDTTPTQPPPAPVVMVAEVTDVAGTLKSPSRAKVEGQVAESLQQYAEAAFLGDYPRSDFGTAFAGFTPGAAKSAEHDRDLLTGQLFGQAESVTAKRLSASLSVLAPRGKVAGATARVRFLLDVDGTPITVRGRLLLTPAKQGWRIFGYDVSSDAADSAAAPTAGGTTGGDS